MLGAVFCCAAGAVLSLPAGGACAKAIAGNKLDAISSPRSFHTPTWAIQRLGLISGFAGAYSYGIRSRQFSGCHQALLISSKPQLIIVEGKKPYCAVPHTIENQERARKSCHYAIALLAPYRNSVRNTHRQNYRFIVGVYSVTLVTRRRAGVAGVGTEGSGV